MKYRVHRVSTHPVSMPVKIGEDTVDAAVMSTEVELVPEGHLGGTLRLNYPGASQKAATEKYKPDAVVEIAEDAIIVVAP